MLLKNATVEVYTQPARDVPGMSADVSLNVLTYGTFRRLLGHQHKN